MTSASMWWSKPMASRQSAEWTSTRLVTLVTSGLRATSRRTTTRCAHLPRHRSGGAAMLLDIDPAVFATPAEGNRATATCQLLMLLTDGPHEWRPNASTAIAAERFRSAAMPALGALRELIDKCVEETAN